MLGFLTLETGASVDNYGGVTGFLLIHSRSLEAKNLTPTAWIAGLLQELNKMLWNRLLSVLEYHKTRSF